MPGTTWERMKKEKKKEKKKKEENERWAQHDG